MYKLGYEFIAIESFLRKNKLLFFRAIEKYKRVNLIRGRLERSLVLETLSESFYFRRGK